MQMPTSRNCNSSSTAIAALLLTASWTHAAGAPDADAAALASLSRFFPSGVSLASSSMASARSPAAARAPVIPPLEVPPLHHGHDLEPRPVAAATNLGAPVAAELKRERHDELDFPRHRVVRGRGLHHRRDPIASARGGFVEDAADDARGVVRVAARGPPVPVRARPRLGG